MIRPPRCSTLFPYTTLFRSHVGARGDERAGGARLGAGGGDVYDHGRLRRQLGLDDVLHRVDEAAGRSEEHTSELQSPCNLVCRLLLEKKKNQERTVTNITDS